MSAWRAQRWLPGLLLASVSYALCFPTSNLPPFSLLALPGLLWALENIDTKLQSFLAAILFSSLFALLRFSWIIETVQNLTGASWLLGFLWLLLFCVVAAPQIYAFLWIGLWAKKYISRHSLYLQVFFWPSLYVALEYLARFFKAFPEHIGNSMVFSLALAQNASWGGVSALSFIPLMIGSGLWFAWRKRSRVSYLLLGLSAGMALLAWTWGCYELARIEALGAETSLKLTIAQANIPSYSKLQASGGNADAIGMVIDRYLAHTAEAARLGTDLVIWPETAYPLNFPTQSRDLSAYSLQSSDRVSANVKASRVAVLFGGHERVNGSRYNSLILLGGDGIWQSSYRKANLVIFGEKIPFSDWFPVLKRINPGAGDFNIGPGPQPILWTREQGNLKIGANICYEDILPSYLRALANNGAQVFINASNDSWFGSTQEPWQHLFLAQLRSIENRIPLVRATNTGLSTAFAASGRNLGIGPLLTQQNLVFRIPVNKQKLFSLYGAWGDWFPQLLLALSFFVLMYIRRRPAQ